MERIRLGGRSPRIWLIFSPIRKETLIIRIGGGPMKQLNLVATFVGGTVLFVFALTCWLFEDRLSDSPIFIAPSRIQSETVIRRSEERRVRKECVRTVSFRWSPYH